MALCRSKEVAWGVGASALVRDGVREGGFDKFARFAGIATPVAEARAKAVWCWVCRFDDCGDWLASPVDPDQRHRLWAAARHGSSPVALDLRACARASGSLNVARATVKPRS